MPPTESITRPTPKRRITVDLFSLQKQRLEGCGPCWVWGFANEWDQKGLRSSVVVLIAWMLFSVSCLSNVLLPLSPSIFFALQEVGCILVRDLCHDGAQHGLDHRDCCIRILGITKGIFFPCSVLHPNCRLCTGLQVPVLAERLFSWDTQSCRHRVRILFCLSLQSTAAKHQKSQS